MPSNAFMAQYGVAAACDAELWALRHLGLARSFLSSLWVADADVVVQMVGDESDVLEASPPG